VRRAKAGQLTAFNTLVLRHQDAIYSLALRFLGNREDAEDPAQEAFIRAYQKIDSFKGDRFRSWLFTIVSNVARDELRKQQRRPQRSLDEARDDLDPPDRGPTPESEALACNGVEERNIATRFFNIYPQYSQFRSCVFEDAAADADESSSHSTTIEPTPLTPQPAVEPSAASGSTSGSIGTAVDSRHDGHCRRTRRASERRRRDRKFSARQVPLAGAADHRLHGQQPAHREGA